MTNFDDFDSFCKKLKAGNNKPMSVKIKNKRVKIDKPVDEMMLVHPELIEEEPEEEE